MHARNFTTNVPKILDLKSSSEQIFSRKLSLGAHVFRPLVKGNEALGTRLWVPLTGVITARDLKLPSADQPNRRRDHVSIN